MSICATIWRLRFPKEGDDHLGTDWVTVLAQGVLPHVGSPTPGHGYEMGDPFATFLPPALETDSEGLAPFLRAVVFVTEGSPKGTPRSPQEYAAPLLVMSGESYASIGFDALWRLLCDALRGDSPRTVATWLAPDGSARVFFDDGTSRQVDA